MSTFDPTNFGQVFQPNLEVSYSNLAAYGWEEERSPDE